MSCNIKPTKTSSKPINMIMYAVNPLIIVDKNTVILSITSTSRIRITKISRIGMLSIPITRFNICALCFISFFCFHIGESSNSPNAITANNANKPYISRMSLLFFLFGLSEIVLICCLIQAMNLPTHPILRMYKVKAEKKKPITSKSMAY